MKKKSISTPGVLLTLNSNKNISNMWRMGNYSRSEFPTFKRGEVGIGMGLEKGSRCYISVLTSDGGIYSILESDLEIL